MTLITTYGIQMQSAALINMGQKTLENLSTQLATGKKSPNLVDYTASEARKLLDFRNTMTKREAYVSGIESVKPRMKAYQDTLAQMSDIATQILRTIGQAPSAQTAQNTSIQGLIEGFAKQIEFHLNQKIGDRYIYAGSRYSTAPASDILALALPPAETYPATSPNLPPWDADAGSPSAAAWDSLSTTIDDGVSLTYNIRSTDTGIQEMVQGLRWAYAATQDATNYQTYMQNAQTELTNAVQHIRDLESTVAANTATLDQTKKQHSLMISDLKNSIDNIQNVDINEVATKVTFYQTQLQASYSVTASLAQLTILKYL